MRSLALAVAAGAVLAATHANAASFPVNRMSGADTGLIDRVAVRVYVHEGHRYCFYFNGWHGPGWYRCGFAYRRGFGWGGVYGWNDWGYGPAERRFGHRGSDMQYGVGSGSGTTINSESRSGTSSGTVQTRSRSTSGSGTAIQGGSNVQGGANVQGSGGSTGATVRGGTTTGGSIGKSEQQKQ